MNRAESDEAGSILLFHLLEIEEFCELITCGLNVDPGTATPYK